MGVGEDKIAVNETDPPVCRDPWQPEITVYLLIAEIITFLQGLMGAFGWEMSPSRAYSALYDTLAWFREKHIWHFDQPAFLYVMEQLKARAEKLAGTSTDEDLLMRMSPWNARSLPIPGGGLSVFQIFDWFLPIFRTMEGKMVQFFGNPDKSVGGKEFTKYEALDVVFNAVDKLYKDPHCGTYNSWGQPKAYPWVKFVRDEMYEWHESMKPRAPKPPAGYDPPFSGG